MQTRSSGPAWASGVDASFLQCQRVKEADESGSGGVSGSVGRRMRGERIQTWKRVHPEDRLQRGGDSLGAEHIAMAAFIICACFQRERRDELEVLMAAAEPSFLQNERSER